MEIKPKRQAGKEAMARTTKLSSPFRKVTGTSSLYKYIGWRGEVQGGSYYMIAKERGKKSPVKECLQTTDLAIAKRKVLDAKQRRKSGVGNISLLSLAREFKDTRNGKNQKTIGWVISKLEKTCPFKETNVRKVNPIEISKFVTSLSLNPRSNNLFFETLKGIFELGVIGGYIQANPMALLKRTLRKKTTRKPPRTPTQEQFRKIVEAIRSQKFSDTADASADLVEFLGSAALGEAEAANLDWQNINFETGFMEIQRQKTKVYFSVPIYPDLRPLLERMHQEAGRPRNGKVFKVSRPRKAIATACRNLQLPKFTARNFRQMGIVNLLRAKLDYKLVAKWQGHQDGGILIISTYSQVISDEDTDYEKDQLKRLQTASIEKTGTTGGEHSQDLLQAKETLDLQITT